MTLSQSATLATASLLLFAASAAHAQYPKDNPVYKTRCELLASQDGAIQSGHAPAILVAATKGVPEAQFTTFAIDREKDNDHYVACTLFYLGAIASKSDLDTAKNLAIFAETEKAKATGGSPSFSEKFTRAKVEAAEIRKPALTSAQLEAVLDALTTVPVSLTPPPMPKPIAKKH